MTVQHAPSPQSVAAPRPGIWEVVKDYMMTTDHKKIGTLYILTSIIGFAIAGILAVGLRIQLAVPDNTFLVGNLYNQVLTLHAALMIFFFLIPIGLFGFGNWFLPLQLGVRDVALPRVNTFAVWLFIFSLLLVILGLANGYVMYVATAEEYAAQYYEGGSTLYGPGEAAMFGRAPAGLTRALSSGDVLPAKAARTLKLRPGAEKAILKRNRSVGSMPGTIERIWCSGDTLYANYQLGSVEDWAVTGSLVAGRAQVEVRLDDQVVAWDDDVSVELHLRSLRHNPARWQLRWSGARPGYGYRIRLRDQLESAPVQCVRL